MEKEPRSGRVKTRLGRHRSGSRSAVVSGPVLCRLRRLREPHWPLVLAVAPDREGMNGAVVAATRTGGGDRLGHPGCRTASLCRSFCGAWPSRCRSRPGHRSPLLAERGAGCFAAGAVRRDKLVRRTCIERHARLGPGLRWGLAATLADVDTGDDLKRQIRRLN